MEVAVWTKSWNTRPGLGRLVDGQEEDWAKLVDGKLQEPHRQFTEHWSQFQACFQGRKQEQGPPRIWWPTARDLERSNLAQLMQMVGAESYRDLHAWSVTNRAEFWQKMLHRLDVEIGGAKMLASGDPKNPGWLAHAVGNAATWCSQAPEQKVAIIEANEDGSSKHVSYGELHEMARSFAAGLQSAKFQPGDGVALYLPMNTQCVAAYLGTILAGCQVVSIPDSFAPPEIATRLRLGKAKLVVTMDYFMRGGKRIEMSPKVHEALAENEAQAMVVAIGQTGKNETAWSEFLHEADAAITHSGPLNRTSNVLFSSGTTGEPKAIPWTHLTPIKAATDGHLHQDIQAEDVVAWPTNIGWMMGPWLIYAAFVNRATMFLYQGLPTSKNFLAAANQAGVTIFGLVPAIVRAWAQEGVQPHSLPSVRLWTSTGEASNQHDYLYLMSLASYKAPIIEYCGGTEIGGGHLTGAVMLPASPATFTTPAMGIDFVVLKDDGSAAKSGEMGEIFLIPPSIGLSENLLNKDHDAVYYEGTPIGPEGELLRRHGDQVQVLWNGFWAAQGRADDTMNLGGIKVGSIELETCMNAHPGVLETAAVGIPPATGGADRLVVFAVTTETKDDLKKQLQSLVKEELNPLFRIHDVVIVDELPRTASNKVMRRELRAKYSG